MAGKDAGEYSACRRPTVMVATGFSASNGSCHGNSRTINSGRSPHRAPRAHHTPVTSAGSAGESGAGWACEDSRLRESEALKLVIPSAFPKAGPPRFLTPIHLHPASLSPLPSATSPPCASQLCHTQPCAGDGVSQCVPIGFYGLDHRSGQLLAGELRTYKTQPRRYSFLQPLA